jgi:hypothetical protein
MKCTLETLSLNTSVFMTVTQVVIYPQESHMNFLSSAGQAAIEIQMQ